MKLFVIVLVFSIAAVCRSEIPVYKSTDNTGINKLERIGVIEQYLVNLSGTLQNIEKKLGEKAVPAQTPEMEELKKLQADFTTLKNEDIDTIRTQIHGLSSSVQLLQSKIK